MEIVYSNDKKHLKTLMKVIDKLSLVIKCTRISENEKINSTDFVAQAKALHKRISKVMEKNAKQKAYVRQWESLCEESEIQDGVDILRKIYYNKLQSDETFQKGVSEE